jgi:hypothetical protein
MMNTRIEQLRSTTVGGLLRIDAAKELLVAGIERLSQRALSASYQGGTSVTLKVGTTQLNLREGRIELEAKSAIVIETRGENQQASGTATQI